MAAVGGVGIALCWCPRRGGKRCPDAAGRAAPAGPCAARGWRCWPRGDLAEQHLEGRWCASTRRRHEDQTPPTAAHGCGRGCWHCAALVPAAWRALVASCA